MLKPCNSQAADATEAAALCQFLKLITAPAELEGLHGESRQTTEEARALALDFASRPEDAQATHAQRLDAFKRFELANSAAVADCDPR